MSDEVSERSALEMALRLIDHLMDRVKELEGQKFPSSLPRGGRLEAAKRANILTALREADWVQKDAAALLGITPRVLNYQVQVLGISHRRWRRYNGEVKQVNLSTGIGV